MSKQGQADMYVLDVLASDIESVEDVLRMLNTDTELGWHREWGRRFDRDDVVQSLVRLMRDDAVQTYLWDASARGLVAQPRRALPPADFDEAWYGLTERGRLLHANWEPGPARGD